jgi:hypothetical protein
MSKLNHTSVDDMRSSLQLFNPENIKECLSMIHDLVDSLIDEMEHQKRVAAIKMLDSKINVITKKLEKFKRERKLEHILRCTGKMFPITPEQVRAFEKLGIHHEIPAGCDDPEAILGINELIRRCRVCGCTDHDCHQCIEKTGEPCHWVEEDLCSACKV